MKIAAKVAGLLPSRLGLMGLNRRNRDCIYPHNPRKYFPNVDDKLLCKELLAAEGVPVPDTYHVIDGSRSLRTWPEKVEAVSSFVIKPNKSYGGRGIAVIQRNDDGYVAGEEAVSEEDVTAHLRRVINGAFSVDNIDDKAYLEETVCNSEGLGRFQAEQTPGVADIRLIYLQRQVIMGMLRVPTQESGGKANLHQGGLGIGIDLDTGCSLGGCYKGRTVELHPETGSRLDGIPIPEFNRMLEYGARIYSIVGLDYVGIDFVCDINKGAMVLEVNARPGLAIQIANKAGLAGRMGLC